MSAAAPTTVETDQEPGALHPRETFDFVGHDSAEQMLAQAFEGARMHHAWLITGPRGVGKATLAHRFARVALGARRTGKRPFDTDPEDPVVRRMRAQSHGDIHVLRRGLNDRGKPRGEITVDEARALSSFFTMKSGDGGWRIAIVDAADELNRNAANALLKTLEEPPARTALLLVCHTPGRLLPTIRSRCRRLDLRALPETDVREALSRARGDIDPAAVRLSAGCPGRAIALAAAGAGDLGGWLEKALSDVTRKGASAFLAEAFKGGDRSERLRLFLSLLRDWIRTAVARATGAEDGHDPLMAQLCSPERALEWASAYDQLLELEREWDGLDLDPAHAFARAARIVERAAA